jgi:hypothetical protein
MRKLLVPILVVIVVVQAIMLWLWRDASPDYPRVFMQDGVYVVELLDEDMEDDSVRSVKYRLELFADEFGQWSVVDQSSTWACWPGRGNQDFGDEWCE